MFSRIKQMLDLPSAWRTEKVLHVTLPKDSKTKVVSGFDIDPKNIWVDDKVTVPKDSGLKASIWFEEHQKNLKVKQGKPYLPLKAESKISEWVDDINNMPWKFEGEIINNEDILPSWDITFKYFDGRTEKMKIKYKKRDGYSNYRQMQAIYKCILKNWRERK